MELDNVHFPARELIQTPLVLHLTKSLVRLQGKWEWQHFKDPEEIRKIVSSVSNTYQSAVVYFNRQYDVFFERVAEVLEDGK